MAAIPSTRAVRLLPGYQRGHGRTGPRPARRLAAGLWFAIATRRANRAFLSAAMPADAVATDIRWKPVGPLPERDCVGVL